MPTIYTASLTTMNKIIKENESINKTGIYLVTRSNSVATSAIKNGWNYMQNLGPSWDLFNKVKKMKEEDKWDKDSFEHFYKPNYSKELTELENAKSLVKIWDKLNEGTDVYIVCYCSDHEICHRSILGQVMSKLTKLEVTHL